MHPCPGSPPEPNQAYPLAEQLALFVHYLQMKEAIVDNRRLKAR